MISYLIAAFAWYGLVITDVISSNDHAIYVSVLELEQSAGENGGDIRIKVFANDLEDAIYNSSKMRVALLSGSCNRNEIPVSDYFRQHLQITIDGRQMAYTFISCEVNDISIWFNFKYTAKAAWSEIEVKADYLMELFPTQSNVVSIIYNEQKRMFRLTKGDTRQTIKFAD